MVVIQSPILKQLHVPIAQLVSGILVCALRIIQLVLCVKSVSGIVICGVYLRRCVLVAGNTGCNFPFTYMGVTYSTCAVINNQPLCVARTSATNGQFPVSLVGCGGLRIMLI